MTKIYLYEPKTDEQIKAVADTLGAYMSLNTLSDELDQIKLNYKSEPDDERFLDLQKIFNRAISDQIPF